MEEVTEIPIDFSRRQGGEGAQGWEVTGGFDSISISSSSNSQDLGGYDGASAARGGMASPTSTTSYFTAALALRCGMASPTSATSSSSGSSIWSLDGTNRAGVGIIVGVRGADLVVESLAHSIIPACEQDKIQVGDILESIDGARVVGWRIRDVIPLLQGDPLSMVTLGVLRGSERAFVTLTRGLCPAPDNRSRHGSRHTSSPPSINTSLSCSSSSAGGRRRSASVELSMGSQYAWREAAADRARARPSAASPSPARADNYVRTSASPAYVRPPRSSIGSAAPSESYRRPGPPPRAATKSPPRYTPVPPPPYGRRSSTPELTIADERQASIRALASNPHRAQMALEELLEEVRVLNRGLADKGEEADAMHRQMEELAARLDEGTGRGAADRQAMEVEICELRDLVIGLRGELSWVQGGGAQDEKAAELRGALIQMDEISVKLQHAGAREEELEQKLAAACERNEQLEAEAERLRAEMQSRPVAGAGEPMATPIAVRERAGYSPSPSPGTALAIGGLEDMVETLLEAGERAESLRNAELQDQHAAMHDVLRLLLEAETVKVQAEQEMQQASAAMQAEREQWEEKGQEWELEKASLAGEKRGWELERAQWEEKGQAWGIEKAQWVEKGQAWELERGQWGEKGEAWELDRAQWEEKGQAWGIEKARLEEKVQALELEKAQWEEKGEAWELERAQWEEKWQAWELEKVQLEEMAQAWELEKARWAEEMRGWELERAQWAEERRGWELEREQWEEEVSALGGAKNQLHLENGRLVEERGAWEVERSAWEAERGELVGEVEAMRAQLDGERRAWEGQRGAWEEERRRWGEERRAQDSDREGWEALRASWAAEKESWRSEWHALGASAGAGVAGVGEAHQRAPAQRAAPLRGKALNKASSSSARTEEPPQTHNNAHAQSDEDHSQAQLHNAETTATQPAPVGAALSKPDGVVGAAGQAPSKPDGVVGAAGQAPSKPDAAQREAHGTTPGGLEELMQAAGRGVCDAVAHVQAEAPESLAPPSHVDAEHGAEGRERGIAVPSADAAPAVGSAAKRVVCDEPASPRVEEVKAPTAALRERASGPAQRSHSPEPTRPLAADTCQGAESSACDASAAPPPVQATTPARGKPPGAPEHPSTPQNAPAPPAPSPETQSKPALAHVTTPTGGVPAHKPASAPHRRPRGAWTRLSDSLWDGASQDASFSSTPSEDQTLSLSYHTTYTRPIRGGSALVLSTPPRKEGSNYTNAPLERSAERRPRTEEASDGGEAAFGDMAPIERGAGVSGVQRTAAATPTPKKVYTASPHSARQGSMWGEDERPAGITPSSAAKRVGKSVVQDENISPQDGALPSTSVLRNAWGAQLDSSMERSRTVRFGDTSTLHRHEHSEADLEEDKSYCSVAPNNDESLDLTRQESNVSVMTQHSWAQGPTSDDYPQEVCPVSNGSPNIFTQPSRTAPRLSGPSDETPSSDRRRLKLSWPSPRWARSARPGP